ANGPMQSITWSGKQPPVSGQGVAVPWHHGTNNKRAGVGHTRSAPAGWHVALVGLGLIGGPHDHVATKGEQQDADEADRDVAMWDAGDDRDRAVRKLLHYADES